MPEGILFFSMFTENFGRATIGKDEPKGRKTGEYMRILIVEDDVNINEMLKEALEKEGYRCVQAFSGTEGRFVLSQERPDLVLLDLMLPGMSGEALLKEIRAKGAIPVIVLSAKDEMDDKVDVLLGGADDYVVKPFEIREVLARVQVQLRKSSGAKETKVLEHNGLAP